MKTQSLSEQKLQPLMQFIADMGGLPILQHTKSFAAYSSSIGKSDCTEFLNFY
jgi:hypothetical protein